MTIKEDFESVAYEMMAINYKNGELSNYKSLTIGQREIKYRLLFVNLDLGNQRFYDIRKQFADGFINYILGRGDYND